MDSNNCTTALRATLGAVMLGLLPSALLAQDTNQETTPETNEAAFAALDELSDATADEQAGIALAGDLAKQGRYLEALAALERVLAVFPKSHNARILHAVFLCDVDDKQGGLVELSQIKTKHVGDEAMNVALARCSKGAE